MACHVCSLSHARRLCYCFVKALFDQRLLSLRYLNFPILGDSRRTPSEPSNGVLVVYQGWKRRGSIERWTATTDEGVTEWSLIDGTFTRIGKDSAATRQKTIIVQGEETRAEVGAEVEVLLGVRIMTGETSVVLIGIRGMEGKIPGGETVIEITVRPSACYDYGVIVLKAFKRRLNIIYSHDPLSHHSLCAAGCFPMFPLLP